MSSAEQIAIALNARPIAPGKWMARCIAHDEKSPSLSIRASDTGRALVYCFGGCEQGQVIEALKARGLWERAGAPARATRPAPAPTPTAPETVWQLRELDRLMCDVEIIALDAPYIVVGEILEGAARITYHCLAQVALALCARTNTFAAHVSRWRTERMEAALFEPRGAL